MKLEFEIEREEGLDEHFAIWGDKAPEWRRMKAQVEKDEGLSGEG